MRTAFLAAALLAGLGAGTAQAQRPADTAIFGVRAPIISLDPAISGLGTMHGYYRHIYDSLVFLDPRSKIIPGVAESWRVIDDLTWEFKLRPGVKCHDGTPMDAASVVSTYNRLFKVPNSDNLTAGKMRPVRELQVVNPLLIRFVTKEPYPGLLAAIPEMHLLCASVPETATTDEINSGRLAIGSGPFRNVSWQRGSRWELERFEDWWGNKPDFKHVTLREIPNDAARMASMQAGDIDAADYIPPLDVKRLTANPSIEVFRTPSNRTLHLGMDTIRPQAPFVTDKDGKPLEKNPFQDVRVRRAFALAISEDLILDRIMEGLAQRATQGVPTGMEGYDSKVKPTPYDPEAAKKLMAEAGYPNGFKVTLHCPNDRYVNDAAICQAVGVMLSRIGVQVAVEAMPTNVYFPRLTKLEFGFWMLAWGNNAGDASSFLRDVMETRDKAKGTGSWNMGVSLPELDKKIDQATMLMDLERRSGLMAEVMGALIRDQAYIPLHSQLVLAATRKGLTYTPNSDEATLALGLRKK